MAAVPLEERTKYSEWTNERSLTLFKEAAERARANAAEARKTKANFQRLIMSTSSTGSSNAIVTKRTFMTQKI